MSRPRSWSTTWSNPRWKVRGGVAQARGRVHVDGSVAIQDADDEAQPHGRTLADGTESHDVGGDAVDLFARMDEVAGARTHKHLNASGGRHLEGGHHLVEGWGQAPARQVGADLNAVRSPIAGAVYSDGVLDADFHDSHGCHLS